jgi:hypothetical protein
VERVNRLDEQLKVIGRSIEIIWNNQKELTKSEELLDEQFAVSTRMTISNFNSLTSRWNQLLQYMLPDEGEVVKPYPDTRKALVQMLIGYSDVNKLFADWAEFRKRKDFREHMREWFMGEDLSSLPPEAVSSETAKKTGEQDVDRSGDTASKGAENATEPNPSPEDPPAAVPQV